MDSIWIQVWTLQFPCRSCTSISQRHILNHQQQATLTSLLLQELVTKSNFELSKHVLIQDVNSCSSVSGDSNLLCRTSYCYHYQANDHSNYVTLNLTNGFSASADLVSYAEMTLSKAITTSATVIVTPHVEGTPSSANSRPTLGT